VVGQDHILGPVYAWFTPVLHLQRRRCRAGPHFGPGLRLVYTCEDAVEGQDHTLRMVYTCEDAVVGQNHTLRMVYTCEDAVGQDHTLRLVYTCEDAVGQDHTLRLVYTWFTPAKTPW
jgi:hypothetical protein